MHYTMAVAGSSDRQHGNTTGITSSFKDTLIDVRGKVVNEKGEPLQGVSVTIKGTTKGTSTDEKGEFILKNVEENAILIFTSVNMETFEVKVNGKGELMVKMKRDVKEEEAVTVVNTGYQEISPERATGSFVKVDNELLNRRVSTDMLSRIEGIASGVLFK